MRKWKIALLFACLMLFNIITTQTNSQIAGTNQNATIQTALTHNVDHVFSMDSFNVAGSQFLNTEGNDSVILTNETELQQFQKFDNFTSLINWTTSSITLLNQYAGRYNVCRFNSPPFGGFLMKPYSPVSINGSFTFSFYVPANLSEAQTINIWTIGTNTEPAEEIYLLPFNATHCILDAWDGGGLAQVRVVHYNEWHTIKVTYFFNPYIYNVTFDGIEQGHYHYQTPAANNFYIFEFLTSPQETQYSFYLDWFNETYYAYVTTTNPVGSYVSPVLDLGFANNHFYNSITSYATIPNDSGLTLKTRISLNNISWTPFSPTPLNLSLGVELGRYIQFLLNFTSSSDFSETPAFLGFTIDWTETMPNQAPFVDNISPENNSVDEDVNVNIQCLVHDMDGDNVTLSLYVNDTLVTNETGWQNGTIFNYGFDANYSTTYTFHITVNDSEDSTDSGSYIFTTVTPPTVTGITVTKISALSYNVSAIPTSYNSGMLDLTLYNDSDEIVYFWFNCDNNTRQFIVINLTEYDTTYTFYFEANVGAIVISSENFSITTENASEPVSMFQYAALIMVLVLASIVGLAFAARKKKK
jgi:hypothetical protein